ncbi:MAG: excinuclease ABC subunit UvrC, partial [Candidatus Hodarchaeota archaeon]
YIDKGAVASTLKMVRNIFPYCSCESRVPVKKRKACLYYHLKQCPAPCANQDDDEAFRGEYLDNIKNIVLFLRGSYRDLMKRLEVDMEVAKENMEYEKAAVIRDKIFALEKTFKPQSVIFTNHDEIDIIVFSKNEDELIILVMEIRDGRLTGKIPFIFDLERQVEPDDDILGKFLIQRYNGSNMHPPSKIILEKQLKDMSLLQSIIQKETRNAVKSIVVPGGDSQYESLFKMGKKNILHLLYKRKLNRDIASFDQVEALKELVQILHLKGIPVIIEAYDISNIQGKFPAGSKVCFKDGKPYKKEYRRYKIQSGEEPDDYKMMAEVISRRAKRIVEGRDNAPDLILIDGGKGQLNAALDALKEQELTGIPMLGLAKQEEEIFRPGEKESLRLDDDSKALMLLKRIRDESHRFAIKYHKQLRQKGMIDELEEILRGIDNIGKKRAILLKKEFKTIDGIRKASIDELEGILKSKKAANALYDHFH